MKLNFLFIIFFFFYISLNKSVIARDPGWDTLHPQVFYPNLNIGPNCCVPIKCEIQISNKNSSYYLGYPKKTGGRVLFNHHVTGSTDLVPRFFGKTNKKNCIVDIVKVPIQPFDNLDFRTGVKLGNLINFSNKSGYISLNLSSDREVTFDNAYIYIWTDNLPKNVNLYKGFKKLSDKKKNLKIKFPKLGKINKFEFWIRWAIHSRISNPSEIFISDIKIYLDS